MKILSMIAVVLVVAVSCASAQDPIADAIRNEREFQRKINNGKAIQMNRRMAELGKRIAKLEKAARKVATVEAIKGKTPDAPVKKEGYSPGLPEIVGGLMVVAAGAAAAKNAKGKSL